jgi:hypothetical protein
MPVVVVGGPGRNVGKTSLICGIIANLPEYSWIAIKVTSDDHGSPEALWEREGSVLSSDTARFRSAGAHRAFLLTGNEDQWPALLQDLKGRVEQQPAAFIFESNRIVKFLRPDVYLAVRSPEEGASKPSFQLLEHLTNATVLRDRRDEFIPGTQPTFKLADLTHLSPELQQWLRDRLPRSEQETFGIEGRM